MENKGIRGLFIWKLEGGSAGTESEVSLLIRKILANFSMLRLHLAAHRRGAAIAFLVVTFDGRSPCICRMVSLMQHYLREKKTVTVSCLRSSTSAKCTVRSTGAIIFFLLRDLSSILICFCWWDACLEQICPSRILGSVIPLFHSPETNKKLRQSTESIEVWFAAETEFIYSALFDPPFPCTLSFSWQCHSFTLKGVALLSLIKFLCIFISAWNTFFPSL